MNAFVIHETAPADRVRADLRDAFATFVKGHGFRIVGFTAEGTRWCVDLSDSLATQICAQVANEMARRELHPVQPRGDTPS